MFGVFLFISLENTYNIHEIHVNTTIFRKTKLINKISTVVQITCIIRCITTGADIYTFYIRPNVVYIAGYQIQIPGYTGYAASFISGPSIPISNFYRTGICVQNSSPAVLDRPAEQEQQRSRQTGHHTGQSLPASSFMYCFFLCIKRHIESIY